MQFLAALHLATVIVSIKPANCSTALTVEVNQAKYKLLWQRSYSQSKPCTLHSCFLAFALLHFLTPHTTRSLPSTSAHLAV